MNDKNLNIKTKFNFNKKIIIIVSLLIISVAICYFFIKDYLDTSNQNDSDNKNQYNSTPLTFKQYIPEEGELVFFTFILNKNDNNILKQQNNFRKAIYHAIDRNKLKTDNPSLTIEPTSLLFNQNFYYKNPAYFPCPKIPFQASEPTYTNDDLCHYGFNFDKALNLLKYSWDSLTETQKSQSYKFKFYIDPVFNDDLPKIYESNFIDNIIQQINNLFETFISQNNLHRNSLIIEKDITDQQTRENMDINIDIVPPQDEYNAEDYYWYCINSYSHYLTDYNIPITFDFSMLKDYLCKQESSGKTIKPEFFQGKTKEINFKYDTFYSGISRDTGLYKDTLTNFFDFYCANILDLLPRTTIPKQNSDEELKQLREKLYEKIFF
ncbi:hypothetical protein [Candidatus Phytoplasma fraxini]|uniref:Uncharacterized protein n=1 Tax=Ash yellows phytoplasma TaxID=35780 RepID=A0ABZ2UB33_ASHYP